MDKDTRRGKPVSGVQDKTARISTAEAGDAQQTRPHERVSVGSQQQAFNMDKLRRDLEESKRLHDEAKRRQELAKARKAQSKEAFQAAERAANARQAETKLESQEANPENNRVTAPRKGKEERRAVNREARAMASFKDKKKNAAKKTLAAKKSDENRALMSGLKRRGIGCLVYLILFCVVIGVAFGTLWMVRAHNAATPIEDIPTSQRAAVAMEREKSNVYLLLAGTDQRADEASRSDTIIYAALRPVDRKIEMVSIPRDSLVDIPGVGEDKINASLAYGGTELLAETVEELVDNPVDHTVLINFDSFANIIDAMGGITIDVPERMYLPEEGIDLEAGEQKLDGHDALAFVRWRGDGTGDIGRMERQSEFMQALTEKVRHLTPWRAVMTAWAVSHEVETDLSLFDMAKLAWNFIGMSGDALEYQHFNYETPYINGVSYVILDDQSVNEVVQLMKYGIVLDDGYDDESGYY